MSARQGRRRRWVPLAVVLAMVILVVAAITIRLTVLRDRARPIPVDQARERFRTAVTSAGTSGPTAEAASPLPHPSSSAAIEPLPSLPAEGVYRYSTVGQESIDALGGATHGYPAETTITVVPDGCGVMLRWDALAERRDEWRLCATRRGIELQPTGLQYHEFFGHADAEDVICDRTILIVPVSSESPAPPVRQTCMLAEDPWSPTWEVLEDTERTVGGGRIDVLHVRMTVDDSDGYWEHTVVDWYVAADGLPVEVMSEKSSRSPSPVGAVVYEERYRLGLEALVPLD